MLIRDSSEANNDILTCFLLSFSHHIHLSGADFNSSTDRVSLWVSMTTRVPKLEVSICLMYREIAFCFFSPRINNCALSSRGKQRRQIIGNRSSHDLLAGLTLTGLCDDTGA